MATKSVPTGRECVGAATYDGHTRESTRYVSALARGAGDSGVHEDSQRWLRYSLSIVNTQTPAENGMGKYIASDRSVRGWSGH